MNSEPIAVVFEQPGQMQLRPVGLPLPEPGDCLVEVEWTGISTGTERLLWDGRMPSFPGLGYPLVPGYECVGRVRQCTDPEGPAPGTRVFVPGSRGFTDARGLFGGAAGQLVAPADRLVPLPDGAGEEAVLLALAATAAHIVARAGAETMPELIVGHGVLGRLLARLVIALGGEAPTVWETDPARRGGSADYPVLEPAEDTRRDYGVVCDVSGDADTLDGLVDRLRPGGRIVLAGFYHQPLQFRFPPAFIREIDIRVAAEWQPADMQRAAALVADGALPLGGLITHRRPVDAALSAYHTAFNEPGCIKMILDWRSA